MFNTVNVCEISGKHETRKVCFCIFMYLNNKIIIEQDVDGIFLADVPELPGCHTQGQTLEEVRERVKEAIELWFEVKK